MAMKPSDYGVHGVEEEHLPAESEGGFMKKLHTIARKNMEKVIIVSILLGGVLGIFLINEKSVVLNFYYIPVLIIGYYLGRRHAVLAANFCVLSVIFYTVLYPDMFLSRERSLFHTVSMLSAWGGFLVLVAVMASYLYDLNQQRIRELREAYVGVLEILTKYLETKDECTKGHSLRVAELARDTAAAMSLGEEQVETIRVAGMLHDIGKVGISSAVISKATALTEEERELMKSHVEKGNDILRTVRCVLQNAVPLVMAHHRYHAVPKTDEKGKHPFREIPLGARIIAVADAFDAMTTDRPYRKAMQLWDALEELKRNAGTQFDPKVVEVFGRVAATRVERV